LDLTGIISIVTALIAILSAVLAILRTMNNRERIDDNQITMSSYVDRKTNGLWENAELSLQIRFNDLEKQLRREMHERIGREIGDIRQAYKNPPQVE